MLFWMFFFFSSRRRHTRCLSDWSSDVCSSDLMVRRLLSVWAEFLDSEASRYVLDDSPSGWLSPVARESLRLHEFQIDPDAEFFGFKSWNDFFIRRFKAGRRPVARPDDQKAIVSACESQPYRIDRKSVV